MHVRCLRARHAHRCAGWLGGRCAWAGRGAWAWAGAGAGPSGRRRERRVVVAVLRVGGAVGACGRSVGGVLGCAGARARGGVVSRCTFFPRDYRVSARARARVCVCGWLMGVRAMAGHEVRVVVRALYG